MFIQRKRQRTCIHCRIIKRNGFRMTKNIDLSQQWLCDSVRVSMYSLKDSLKTQSVAENHYFSRTVSILVIIPINSIPHSEVQGNSGNTGKHLKASKPQRQRSSKGPAELEYSGSNCWDVVDSNSVLWRSCMLLSYGPAHQFWKWGASHCGPKGCEPLESEAKHNILGWVACWRMSYMDLFPNHFD